MKKLKKERKEMVLKWLRRVVFVGCIYKYKKEKGTYIKHNTDAARRRCASHSHRGSGSAGSPMLSMVYQHLLGCVALSYMNISTKYSITSWCVCILFWTSGTRNVFSSLLCLICVINCYLGYLHDIQCKIMYSWICFKFGFNHFLKKSEALNSYFLYPSVTSANNKG